MDVHMEADQSPAKYLVYAHGLQDCQNLYHEIFVIYNSAKSNSTLIRKQDTFTKEDFAVLKKGYDCNRVSKDIACALDLKTSKRFSLKKKPDEVIYIPFDINTYSSFTDEMTDNSYRLYGLGAFYPAYLGIKREEIRIPQVNGVSFKYPSSPILSQPEDITNELICSQYRRSVQCKETPLFCECLLIVEILPRKVIELILIDEGAGGNTSHTFHVHGYNVDVIGRGTLKRPVNKEEIVLLDRENKLRRNLVNPPKKNNFVVPNKGYIILRVFTNNLGYWLWEARDTGTSPETSGLGMQFLMKVGTPKYFPQVPIDFPTCGNNKGPDLLFEPI